MKSYIEQRVIDIANYTIDNNATVRATAKAFGVSKSTIHKDIMERLPTISTSLYEKVYTIIQKNKAERHIRGGIATREKYLIMKQHS